jgi:hypothetical protein
MEHDLKEVNLITAPGRQTVRERDGEGRERQRERDEEVKRAVVRAD